MRLFLWLPGYAGGGVTGVADGADVAGWEGCWGCVGAAVTWGWAAVAGGAGRGGVTCCLWLISGGVAGVAAAVTWPWADKNWKGNGCGVTCCFAVISGWVGFYVGSAPSRGLLSPRPVTSPTPQQQPRTQQKRHCPGPSVQCSRGS
jgi:hypothetical protein